MTEDEKFKAWMKGVVDGSKGKIQGSKVFSSLLSKDYLENPQCLLELAMAIVMDKPIALIVMKGTKVPKNLQTVAKVIEYVDPEIPSDMKRAVRCIGKVISELENK